VSRWRHFLRTTMTPSGFLYPKGSRIPSLRPQLSPARCRAADQKLGKQLFQLAKRLQGTVFCPRLRDDTSRKRQPVPDGGATNAQFQPYRRGTVMWNFNLVLRSGARNLRSARPTADRSESLMSLAALVRIWGELPATRREPGSRYEAFSAHHSVHLAPKVTGLQDDITEGSLVQTAHQGCGLRPVA